MKNHTRWLTALHLCTLHVLQVENRIAEHSTGTTSHQQGWDPQLTADHSHLLSATHLLRASISPRALLPDILTVYRLLMN